MTKTLTGRTEPVPCPHCSYELDAFTCLTAEVRPRPGDFTVCINCASVLTWDADMKIQLSALIHVPKDIRYQFVKLVNGVKEINKEKNRGASERQKRS